tara:strand:+ start:120 stop:674 length:555 start_codon:yes stop_codon:yes gene_type:complete
MPIFTTSLRPGTAIPSGKHGGIIQVESVKKTDTFSTSNDSFVDVTGLTCTITPHSTNSKIIVSLSLSICGDYFTSYARIERRVSGASNLEIFKGTGAGVRPTHAVCTTGENSTQDSHGQIFIVHRQFIDEPGTTSEITYQVQAQGRPDNASNGDTRINFSVPDRNTNSYDARLASELMVMEVSG